MTLTIDSAELNTLKGGSFTAARHAPTAAKMLEPFRLSLETPRQGFGRAQAVSLGSEIWFKGIAVNTTV